MKRKEQAISREQIQEALKRFQQQGGLAKKLPDQVTPARNLVGAKFGALEAVSETLAASPE